MIVSIGDDMRIVASDGLCFELQRRGVQGAKSRKPGAVVWRILGYYGTLCQAAEAALVKSVCDNGERRDARALAEALSAASARIADACTARAADGVRLGAAQN